VGLHSEALQVPGLLARAVAILAVVNAHRLVTFPAPDCKYQEKEQKYEKGRAKPKYDLHSRLFFARNTTGFRLAQCNASPPKRQSDAPRDCIHLERLCHFVPGDSIVKTVFEPSAFRNVIPTSALSKHFLHSIPI
jgi:hypothetical protein